MSDFTRHQHDGYAHEHEGSFLLDVTEDGAVRVVHDHRFDPAEYEEEE